MRDVLLSDYRVLGLKFDPKTLQVQDDGLEAFDIADQVLGRDIYGPIIKTLCPPAAATSRARFACCWPFTSLKSG